jgi:hypothetical protein
VTHMALRGFLEPVLFNRARPAGTGVGLWAPPRKEYESARRLVAEAFNERLFIGRLGKINLLRHMKGICAVAVRSFV